LGTGEWCVGGRLDPWGETSILGNKTEKKKKGKQTHTPQRQHRKWWPPKMLHKKKEAKTFKSEVQNIKTRGPSRKRRRKIKKKN